MFPAKVYVDKLSAVEQNRLAGESGEPNKFKELLENVPNFDIFRE